MDAKEYLLNHSLKEEFVLERGWILGDEFITIPIFDTNGKFVFNKYRQFNGESKFTADPGSHPMLYCAEHVTNIDEVVLCEGEPDCIRLWQEGIPAVTGTFGVTTFNEKIATPLSGKKVYITLDTDEAGVKGISKYIEVLLKVGATPFVVSLPKEFKDVSEYLTGGNNKEDFSLLKLIASTPEQWEEQHQPEEWKLESGAELMERELPPEEWLIERIIPSEGFTFIVGAEATGKSFYTLTLAHAIATGKPWLNQFKVGKQTGVLFIDKENSPRRKKARIAGLSIKDGLDNLHWVKFPHFFELADPKEEDGLSKFAKSLSKQVEKLSIGLIVLDSFADVMVGNENAASDVQGFFDAIRKLFPNKSVLVLHHENKPSQGVSRTSSQRVRGSTNITAQIVSGFRVFAIPKTSNEFVLEQFKAGDAEKLKPFKVELVSKQNPYHPEKTYVSEVKYSGEYYDQEGQAELAEEQITDYLSENIVASRQDVIDNCVTNGVGQRTVVSVLAMMAEEGKIEKIRDGHKINLTLK
jgi:RecA-family ATPase